MSHIALIISGLTGRLHSSFALANKLQSEGHTITYFCPEDVKEKVEFQGFSYVQLPSINFSYKAPELNNIKSASWIKRCVYYFQNRSKHYETGKNILQLPVYEEILKELKPDKAIIDMELHDIIFAALAVEIQVILYTAWFSNKISSRLPPLRSTIIPKKEGERGSFNIVKAWVKIRSKVWARLWLNRINFKNYRRIVLKTYAQEIGFPIQTLIPTNMPPLFVFTSLPIWTMTIKSMDFPHVPPKNLRYIGPMVHSERDRKDEDSAIHKNIDRIILSKNKSHKKLIYCSVSSFVKGDVNFLKKVIQAVSGMPNWILIISLGRNISVQDIGDTPTNIHLFDWVPQLKVLEEADCNINHGGINSINECIHFATPMLVYSGKRFDQNGNAARIAYHGLGIRADKDRDSSAVIRQNLMAIFSDSRYKENVNMIHGMYKEYQRKKLSPYL